MSIWGMTYTVVMPLGRVQGGVLAGVSRGHMAGLLGRYAGAPAAIIFGSLVMQVFIFFGVSPNRRVRNLGTGVTVPEDYHQGKE